MTESLPDRSETPICNCPDMSLMRPNEVVQSKPPCPIHDTPERMAELSRHLVPARPAALVSLEEADLIQAVTTVVREADENFEREGGSSRHWVRDHFLPLLDTAGLQIARKPEQRRSA